MSNQYKMKSATKCEIQGYNAMIDNDYTLYLGLTKNYDNKTGIYNNEDDSLDIISNNKEYTRYLYSLLTLYYNKMDIIELLDHTNLTSDILIAYKNILIDYNVYQNKIINKIKG